MRKNRTPNPQPEQAREWEQMWRERSRRLCSLDFPQAQFQMIAKLDRLKHEINNADQGYEFDATSQLTGEIAILAQRLGFPVVPITLFVQRPDPSPSPTQTLAYDFHLPHDGPITRIVSSSIGIAKVEGEVRNVGVRGIVSEAKRKKAATILDGWHLAAESTLPMDFKADWKTPENQFPHLILLTLYEVLRSQAECEIVSEDQLREQTGPKAVLDLLKPGLARDIARHIIDNPGCSEDDIAYVVKKSGGHVRDTISEKLREHGFRGIQGKGYWPPNVYPK